MPKSVQVPGVYIKETPSAVRTIAGVATSITAFVGYTASGDDNLAQSISNFEDYQTLYGGVASDSELSYAMEQFFWNGGTQAYVVRTPTTNDADLIGDPQAGTGMYALLKVDIFNLLCIPDAANASNPTGIYAAAIALCEHRRTFLLIDPPADVNDVTSAADWFSNKLGVVDPNGAAFFPRLQMEDQLNDSALRAFAPSAVVAGLFARTDAQLGVWKSPAGIQTAVAGAKGLTCTLTNSEDVMLNSLGLNCFRIFPPRGVMLWGARTLAGADATASEWKYIAVRRMALYIEESISRGMQWVTFEPNGEPLWAQIRLTIGAFMNVLFREGAFQGTTPVQAYLVKCDQQTTTQDDINRGFVNIEIGFAPLQPAEFVMLQIQQVAGQTNS